MKKILLLIFMISIFALTACQSKEEAEKVVVYSVNELEEGIYVKTGDEFVKPYSNAANNYGGAVGEPSADRVIWLKDNHYMIPTVYKDSELVYVSSKTPFDTSFTLESFTDAGYTLGFAGATHAGQSKVQGSETPIDVYTIDFNANCYQQSSAYNFIQNIPSGQGAMLYAINEQVLVKENFNAAGALTGLEKDKKYGLYFYLGTKYYYEEAVADTNILYSTDSFGITADNLTTNGYVTIKLPKDLPDGYYAIEGCNIFYYSGEEESKGDS